MVVLRLRDLARGRPWFPPLAFAAAFAVIYAGAVLLPLGQRLDQQLLFALQRLGPGPVQDLWPLLVRVVLPPVLVACVIVLSVVRARRPLRAVIAVLLTVGACVVLSLALKQVLVRPQLGWDEGYVGNTYPSTHVSATIALVVALRMLLPASSVRVRRLLVALAVVVALGNVVGHAHRPSDAVGSVLLVGAVMTATCADLRRLPGGLRPTRDDLGPDTGVGTRTALPRELT